MTQVHIFNENTKIKLEIVNLILNNHNYSQDIFFKACEELSTFCLNCSDPSHKQLKLELIRLILPKTATTKTLAKTLTILGDLYTFIVK